MNLKMLRTPLLCHIGLHQYRAYRIYAGSANSRENPKRLFGIGFICRCSKQKYPVLLPTMPSYKIPKDPIPGSNPWEKK